MYVFSRLINESYEITLTMLKLDRGRILRNIFIKVKVQVQLHVGIGNFILVIRIYLYHPVRNHVHLKSPKIPFQQFQQVMINIRIRTGSLPKLQESKDNFRRQFNICKIWKVTVTPRDGSQCLTPK